MIGTTIECAQKTYGTGDTTAGAEGLRGEDRTEELSDIESVAAAANVDPTQTIADREPGVADVLGAFMVLLCIILFALVAFIFIPLGISRHLRGYR